jgi:hypothetical protein
MREGSAGISDISGAWAAVPSVRSMCMTDVIGKAMWRMGARKAWRKGCVGEEMSG